MKYIREFKEEEERNFYKEQILSMFERVREEFLEFEDDGVVSYQIVNLRYSGGAWITSYNTRPISSNKIDVIDTYLNMLMCWDLEKKMTIEVGLKIPGKLDIDSGNARLNTKSIEFLEDILTTVKRLNDIEGVNEVTIDLNSNDDLYKPVKVIVHFDLKDREVREV